MFFFCLFVFVSVIFLCSFGYLKGSIKTMHSKTMQCFEKSDSVYVCTDKTACSVCLNIINTWDMSYGEPDVMVASTVSSAERGCARRPGNIFWKFTFRSVFNDFLGPEFCFAFTLLYGLHMQVTQWRHLHLCQHLSPMAVKVVRPISLAQLLTSR